LSTFTEDAGKSFFLTFYHI